MTKTEIQQLMAIARPAIIAVYGRQRLKLVKYNDTLVYRGKPLKDIWLQVEGHKFNREEYQLDFVNNYKLNIKDGRVAVLSVGELDI